MKIANFLGLDMARRLGSTVSNRAVSNEMVKLARDCQNNVNEAILNALENNWLVTAIISRVHTTQTSPGSAQVFENLGLAHASVDAKNLGSAQICVVWTETWAEPWFD